MAANSPWIKNVTLATFEADVQAGSETALVVLDFWAPWCAPCRQLTPILEKLAQEYGGRFVLAKVNTEEEQQLAAAFGVQSIPWVLAFDKGQPIDQFRGLMPEPQIREWLDRLLPSKEADAATQARDLEASDPKAAEQVYRDLLDRDEDFVPAKIGLARVLLAQHRQEECQAILDDLERRGFLEPEAQSVKSDLELTRAAAETGGVEAARAAMNAEPDNLSRKLALAEALAAAHQYEEALALCLDLVMVDRAGAGVEAKATMLRMFTLLGPTSELAAQFRRRLATALY